MLKALEARDLFLEAHNLLLEHNLWVLQETRVSFRLTTCASPRGPGSVGRRGGSPTDLRSATFDNLTDSRLAACASRLATCSRSWCTSSDLACSTRILPVRHPTAPPRSLASCACGRIQGYLSHEKTPTPLGTPSDPRHRPTVGS